MAKNKNKTRKQGWVSKILNAGLIALGFSGVIKPLIALGPTPAALDVIIRDATFGLSEGKFNLSLGLRMYTPAGAAAALGFLKSYLMRKFPIRR